MARSLYFRGIAVSARRLTQLFAVAFWCTIASRNAATQTVAPAGVRATFADFTRRQAAGRGTFLTRADVERLHATSFSQLLRMAPRPVRLLDQDGTAVAVSRRGNKAVWDAAIGRLREVPCVMRVMVDGAFEPVGSPLDNIESGSIAAVEIYDGPATIPLELARGANDIGCGLIAVWTRGG